MTFGGHFSTVVTLCAQLTRNLLAIAKFLLFFDSDSIIISIDVLILCSFQRLKGCNRLVFIGAPCQQDWRDHIDQMHQYSGAIDSCMKDTRGQLGRLSDDISRTLEKIASRERYLNQELHYQLNGLSSAHDRRAERKATYRQASVGLADKSRHLAEVCAVLLSVIDPLAGTGSYSAT